MGAQRRGVAVGRLTTLGPTSESSLHDHSHGHGHAHGHAHAAPPPPGTPPEEARLATWRALRTALMLNSAFLVIEAGIAWWTGSLALWSDAAHMVGDVAALGLALAAMALATRAPSPDRSFGLVRAETLGAFTNAILLLAGCALVAAEATERLIGGAAPEIAAWPVLVAGVVGLVINLGSAWALFRADRDNLNARGALMHMLGDALGSVGAIAAAGFMWAGAPLADPIIGLVLAAIVAWGAVGVLREASTILLQFAPSRLPVAAVRETMLQIDGVLSVHELHCWSIRGTDAVLSAHVVAGQGASGARVRAETEAVLRERYGIVHTTLQVEHRGDDDCAAPACP